MKYQIDHKTKFFLENDYKSLYTWSLKEIDESGKIIGRPQIPWSWSLNFTSTVINLSKSVALNSRDNDVSENNSALLKEMLRSELFPEDRSARGQLAQMLDIKKATTFSFFGTKRVIKKFALNIYPVGDNYPESCYAWGTVGWFDDEDFRYIEDEDRIEFHLKLRREKFEAIKESVTANNLLTLRVRLGGVSGFYSDWSPDIETDSIKVLADVKWQEIEIPDENLKDIGCLGAIDDFNLYINHRNHYDISDFNQKIGHDIESKADEPNFENSAAIQNKIDIIQQQKSDQAYKTNQLRATRSAAVALWILVLIVLFRGLIK
jgi:hypothetical protein